MSRLYVGTYTRPIPHVTEASGKGLYVFDFDDSEGSLRHVQTVSGIENPSYLCISPDARRLHALWEVQEWPEGLVSTYSIDAATGTLTYLGIQGSRGWLPTYVTMDSQSRVALVANYGSGSVAMLPTAPGGGLRQSTSFDQHAGSGPDPARQEGPHAHCVVVSTDDRYAFSADLGIDKIIGYRIEYEDLALVLHSELEMPARSGPRHFVFSPSGHNAYVINELANTVSALAYDSVAGRLELLETYPMLPRDFDGESYCADIHFHPSGRFLYGSNRGHDSITVISVDLADGRLDLRGHRSTEGATPRNFAISPDGRFLLAANQDSHSIVTMVVDPDSGLLGKTVAMTSIPAPVCLKFSPTRETKPDVR